MIEDRQLWRQIYDVLRARIIYGELLSGQRLLDVELAKEFGVSRTPVKDALQRLAGDGLVVIVPRRGTFVSVIDGKVLNEVYDIRCVLESYAVEVGIDRATREEVARMGTLLAESEALLGDSQDFEYIQFLSKNTAFHAQIVQCSGNDTLVEIYKRLGIFTLAGRVRYREAIDKARHLVTHEEHKQILKAYEERNKAAAKALVAKHIRKAQSDLMRILDSVNASPPAGLP